MWGQVQGYRVIVDSFRIIPTRVGTRFFKYHRYYLLTDHPHACGDKYARHTAVRSALGSSPRVWGQVTQGTLTERICRIIPTRVGTSTQQPLHSRRYWDHPHACGDKRNLAGFGLKGWGSSPRVWGQGHSKTVSPKQSRIIPTRVGTSIIFTASGTGNEDHPHACGDKKLCNVIIRHVTGSSPRVWGQASVADIYSRLGGIIPTRVGTS